MCVYACVDGASSEDASLGFVVLADLLGINCPVSLKKTPSAASFPRRTLVGLDVPTARCRGTSSHTLTPTTGMILAELFAYMSESVLVSAHVSVCCV